MEQREKKEKLETKRKHAEIRRAVRQAKEQEKEQQEGRSKRRRKEVVEQESSSTSSDSDCEIEEVVVKKKSGKLASIFLGKKEKKQEEDPEVVARRKAFLMSAAPEEIRNRVEQEREKEQEDKPELVLPSGENMHVKQGDDQESEQVPCPLPLRTLTFSSLTSPPVLPGHLVVRAPAKKHEKKQEPSPRLGAASVLATVEVWAERCRGFQVRHSWLVLVLVMPGAEGVGEPRAAAAGGRGL